VVTVTSGETGATLAGVSLAIAGQSYTTDGAGRVTVTAATNSAVAIEAEGFLPRHTRLRQGQTTFSLWPKANADGLTEAATYFMVYDEGRQTMVLWSVTSETALVPSAEIAADSQAMDALRAATARITQATFGRMNLRVDPGATTGPMIRAVIDPDRAATGAAAYLDRDGGAVTGGTIAYRTLSTVRFVGIALHELAHFYGMSHSPDTIDISGPGPGLRFDFSQREVTLMNLMWQRRPGNAWPDNDQGVTTSSRRTQAIHCRLAE
jgi:hypothetical protein